MTTDAQEEPQALSDGGELDDDQQEVVEVLEGWHAIVTSSRVLIGFGALMLLALVPFATGHWTGVHVTTIHAIASVGVLAIAALQRRYGLGAFALFILVLSLLWRFEWGLSDEYMAHLIVVASVFSILASSLNMSVGYTGLMSLSHAGFMGVGAYAFAVLTTETLNPPPGAEVFNLPYWPSIVVAGIVASVVAFIVSPILRLRGHFFVLATVTVMLSLSQVVLAWRWMTNGSLAIREVPRPVIFGYAFDTADKFILFSIPVAIICIVILWRLVESPYGRVLTTIRANPRSPRASARTSVSCGCASTSSPRSSPEWRVRSTSRTLPSRRTRSTSWSSARSCSSWWCWAAPGGGSARCWGPSPT